MLFPTADRGRDLIFVFGLLLTFTFCRRPEPETQAPALRVHWTSAPPVEAEVNRDLVRPPAGEQAWQVEGASATRYEPYPPFGILEPALWVTGSNLVYVTVPGPIPANVSGIEVTLASRNRINVNLSLVRHLPDQDKLGYEHLVPQLKPCLLYTSPSPRD